MIAVEKIRNPEEVQPPHRVGQELAERERPGLPIPQQSDPRDVLRRVWRITPNMRELCGPDRRMILGGAVQRNPEEQPDEAQRSRDDERPVPSPVQSDPGHDERGHEGADVGAGVEDACGERAFLLGEPLGGDFDRGRKVARLAEPEREPRGDESGDRRRVGESHEREDCGGGRTEDRRFGVRHRGQAPYDQGDGIALFRPQPVDHPAGEQKSDRVGELEREDDIGVVDLAPAELLLECRLQDADDLAIDVVDGRREEEQGADDPAVASNAPGDRRLSGGRRTVRHRAQTLSQIVGLRR